MTLAHNLLTMQAREIKADDLLILSVPPLVVRVTRVRRTTWGGSGGQETLMHIETNIPEGLPPLGAGGGYTNGPTRVFNLMRGDHEWVQVVRSLRKDSSEGR